MNPTLPGYVSNLNPSMKERIIPYNPLEDFYYDTSLQVMLSFIVGNFNSKYKTQQR